MTSTISSEPVRVWTDRGSEDGCLVFADGCLVAVLVRLAQDYDALAGRWFVEVGFGPCAFVQAPIFASLDEAKCWVCVQMVKRSRAGAGQASRPGMGRGDASTLPLD